MRPSPCWIERRRRELMQLGSITARRRKFAYEPAPRFSQGITRMKRDGDLSVSNTIVCVCVCVCVCVGNRTERPECRNY